MKKSYKSPTTDIVEIKLREGLLLDPSSGAPLDNDDVDNNVGDAPVGGDTGDDLSRTNNRGSVWDNIW